MRFLIYEVALPQNAAVLRYAGNISGWRRPDATASTQQAGRAWIDEGKALAFAVPSVVVPEETNYVLNVRHPRFSDLRISRPKPFAFDERL
jgi:RES domain-containing protein